MVYGVLPQWYAMLRDCSMVCGSDMQCCGSCMWCHVTWVYDVVGPWCAVPCRSHTQCYVKVVCVAV